MERINKGDILYCKKSFYSVFINGNYYTVFSISNDNDIVYINSNKNDVYWFLLNEKNHPCYLNEYFINKKEERRKKLKNIKKKIYE